jgi:hypothetical protein|tara:strand:+ start:270 stop:2285 length:2016 start_codon:yes stop_codon:yes gene_type:complete
MKKLLWIVVLGLLLSGNGNAASITEELTKLNNLYKEGAITKEEFSKGKSILLKTETKQEVKVEKKVKEKKESKKEVVEKENKIQKEKVVKKTYNQDLTKSYVSLEEIDELGVFERILDAPEGMFKSNAKSFSARAKKSMSDMYLIFVQQKNFMEKNPENLMKAMGYFEFFYMEQLRKKQKSIRKFKESWPDIHFRTKKDIKSLYSLNQARKTMRESMGLTLNDDVQVALERYMTMYNFLNQAEKKRNKLTSLEKRTKKQSTNLKTNLNSLKKNIKLKKENRIDNKEFEKGIKKNISRAKSSLKFLSSLELNEGKFYSTIYNMFEKIISNQDDLDLVADSINLMNAILTEVEKNIIKKEYVQTLDHIDIDSLPEDKKKILASISIGMKMQKAEKKKALQNSVLNLDNNNFEVGKYLEEINENSFKFKSVNMTYDNIDNMKKWATKDWANSWKGSLLTEIKDNDGNLIDLTEENINDIKAQLAMNSFKEMIDIGEELKDSVNENIKEIAVSIQQSGGFNLDEWLNQDFSITLDNYSRLVGNDWGIEINDFKDLTKAVNGIEGTNLTPEEYAQQWESADHWGDSGVNWGEITRGVDLIDQIGSFDAASIAKELGTNLQQVADTIAQAATVGVSTDLEAAAQGLGYGSFADAVAAYNAQYGTSYTVESAKEALGQ